MDPKEIFQSGLHLDPDIRNYLKESSKWAKFLGISGFIACGILVFLILLFAYANSAIFSHTNSYQQSFTLLRADTLLLIYLIMAACGFLVSTVTFRFGQRIDKAIRSDSQADFKKSMSDLRFIFRLYGIFCILYIILMILFVTVAALSNLI